MIIRAYKQREGIVRLGKWLLLFFVLCMVFAPLASGDEITLPRPVTLLHLSSIGFPTAEYRKAAWKINDLKIFHDRLYVGCGDAVENTGPTDVIYYDLKANRFYAEFTVDDEAIYRYQVIDGKLVIPGPDATEDWDKGNVYVLTGEGWKKKRTVTHGIHVNQIASYGNKWYAATGSYFEFEEDRLYPFGGILSSEDEGDSWGLVYASPTDDRSVFRIGSLIAFQDKLYAFPYAYRSMRREEIPSEYHPFLSKTYGDEYLILVDDPLGASDVLTFDGDRWEYIDLVPSPQVCLIAPFLFNGKLILSLLNGAYVDYLALGKGLPGNATSSLYVLDHAGMSKLDFEYDRIRDVVVTNGSLLLLTVKDGTHSIAMTQDLEEWTFYVFPRAVQNPRSIEFDHTTFYIGTEDGNIFRSLGQTERTDGGAVNTHVLKFHGAAELPRDGKWYWAAVREWERWGKLAQFSCDVRKGNVINVTTDNISGMSIFVPFPEIDSTKTVEVRVNNNSVFKDRLDGASELLLTKQEGIMWTVERGDGTEETFHYSRRIMGTSEVPLVAEGLDSPLGSFVADVLSWSVSADVGIIPRSGLIKEISAGNVYLEDVFDAFHRDTVFTFKVKGADLYRMMEFNIQREGRDRCQIAGFTFTYRSGSEAVNNSIATSSIDPAKTYLVATTSFLARRMERFLGRDANCTDTGISVQDGMMRWFEAHGHVQSVEQRILTVE